MGHHYQPGRWSPEVVGPYFRTYFNIFKVPGLTPAERLIYCYLASLQANKAFVSPSQPHIAKTLNLSLRTVRKALLNLESRSMLRILRRRSEDGKLHNTYCVSDQLLADLHASRRKTAKRTLALILSSPKTEAENAPVPTTNNPTPDEGDRGKNCL